MSFVQRYEDDTPCDTKCHSRSVAATGRLLLALVASIIPSMAYLQDVLGFTVLAAGTAFISYSGGIMVAAKPARADPRDTRRGVAAATSLTVGGAAAVGMGVVDTLAPFLVLSIFAGSGLGMAFALAHVVT